MTMISVDSGVSLSVRQAGEGPAVLLIHGWMMTGALWTGVATALADAGKHVVVPDLRGCGASTAAVTRDRGPLDGWPDRPDHGRRPAR
jgi:haloacetate dehalogenase